MKVAYRKRFLKDLASVPANFRGPIERFVFEELPRADSLQSTGKIEKLKGHATFFKARFGDYRVGLSVTADTVTLERVLNRKEIYRKFP
ncbi:MAG TPA: type II toxin-antitoxin system RelE/ParE family toxin [Thermoanaerobaculia bacterium]|nr:type II toxin-antitoxin system RelE/ParE family toxin [Thermoanaerobaculia bacterium]